MSQGPTPDRNEVGAAIDRVRVQQGRHEPLVGQRLNRLVGVHLLIADKDLFLVRDNDHCLIHLVLPPLR